MNDKMTEELIDRLRAMYVATGTNYVQAAADKLEAQAERIKELELDLDVQAKELPVLPGPEYRLSPDSEPSLYDPYDMQAYGAACAAHAREMALSDSIETLESLWHSSDDGTRKCIAELEQLKARK